MRRNLLIHVFVLCAGLAGVLAQEGPSEKPWSPAVPVVGPLPLEAYAERLPMWEQRARSWKVAPETLELLRTAPPARIEVVFGSWCPDSYDHVPPLVAALRAADNADLELELTGVDRQKQDPTGAAARLGVTRVPTVVVLRAGAEVGRVIETPAATMDLDVARILHAVIADAPKDRRSPAPHEKP